MSVLGALVAQAVKVAHHWRDQDGINAAVLDDLVDAVANFERNPMTEKFSIPITEAIGALRVSMRAVLHSHLFIVVRARITGVDLDVLERTPAFTGEGDESDASVLVEQLRDIVRTLLDEVKAQRSDVLSPDRFEELLGECARNGTQRLVNIAINSELDAEDLERLGEAICPTHAIERRRCGCAASDTLVACTCTASSNDEHATYCAIARARRGFPQTPVATPTPDLAALVRDYLTAADAFDAMNYSEPGFKRVGVALGELQSKLRQAVRP